MQPPCPPLAELLAGSSLRALLAARDTARGPTGSPLLALSERCSVSRALAALADAGVRSAPVVACAAHGVAASEAGDVLAGSFPYESVLGWVETAVVVDQLLHCEL